MKKLLKKPYQMNSKEQMEAEELYIIYQLQEKLKDYEGNGLSVVEQEILLNIIKKLLLYSNIDIGKIITRLLRILAGASITIDEIKQLNVIELIELLTVNENDFRTVNLDYEIITKFIYKSLHCMFIRDNNKYVLVYEQGKISHVEIYNNFEEMLCYIIKSKLRTEGEKIG